ncbi:MAG TPA: hypothetical protein VMJ66_09215 [Geobacteraceae bacterium]|nr:hypothetical protein [Geobacteraceae bacterium]
MSDKHADSSRLLNPLQRGSLATTLSVLEEMLCEIEGNFTFGGCKGVLYEVRDDVPVAIHGEVLKRISLIREKIKFMAERFDLEKRSKDASRDFMGKLVYCWEILEGAKARHLRGYGAVAGELEEALDPHLNNIIILVDEMRELVISEKKN